MNELFLDLEIVAPWVWQAPRHVPGAVQALWCRPTRSGGLMFAWQRPLGHVEAYRLERTRTGKEYEEIVMTQTEGTALPPVPLNDGWFYRVSAFNSRGMGPARWVFFFLRRRRDSIFLRVPVRPGLRLGINELVRA